MIDKESANCSMVIARSDAEPIGVKGVHLIRIGGEVVELALMSRRSAAGIARHDRAHPQWLAETGKIKELILR